VIVKQKIYKRASNYYSETSTPYRGDQEPGTTIQARAAAEGNNSITGVYSITGVTKIRVQQYKSVLRQRVLDILCYSNVNETDEDALRHIIYIYIFSLW